MKKTTAHDFFDINEDSKELEEMDDIGKKRNNLYGLFLNYSQRNQRNYEQKNRYFTNYFIQSTES